MAFFALMTAWGVQLNPPIDKGLPIDKLFTDIDSPFKSGQQMHKFASYKEMTDFLQDVQAYFVRLQGSNHGGYGFGEPMARSSSGLFAPFQAQTDATFGANSLETAELQVDFSGTNVQVAGVDEADFLKTDGTYVYIISENKLTIVDAYPANQSKVVSKTSLDIPQGEGLQNMFVNGDELVVFYVEYGEQRNIAEYGYAFQTSYAPTTHALILDISDRSDPSLVRDYEASGQYGNSRMIGRQIFLLTLSGVDYQRPVPPTVTESSRLVATPDVYYFGNPEQQYTFNTVTALDLDKALLDDGSQGLLSETFMIGSGNTVYVSENNIYIAYQENMQYYQTSNKERFSRVIVPLLPSEQQRQIASIENNTSLDSAEKWDKMSEVLQGYYEDLSQPEMSELFSTIQSDLAEYDAIIARDSQKTVIHKISIKGDSVLQYVAKGEVPGRLLNQFSMDENNGMFRIATTSEYSTPQRFVMHNNVYTLDQDMEIAGRLEGVAPNESIYSARFMGDRLYLVTFQRMDPFFVIDLSDDQPKVLGALKLPGFSNYLHPYDKDHVIGIGRETRINEYGGVEFQGVKMALFDVSDVTNPTAVDTYMIGGSETDSEVLRDHRALLFDKEKNVLSIPIFSPEIRHYDVTGDLYEPKQWAGFYVFSLDGGRFELEGEIEHEGNYGSGQSRSFYIDDTLYSVTPGLMKMNELHDIDNEIGRITF